MKKIRYFFLIFVIGFLFFSCNKDKGNVPQVKGQTIIFYMVGQNNLKASLQENIKQIQKVRRDGNSYVVIFTDAYTDNKAHLLEVADDGSITIVKSYPENFSPVDPAFITQTLNEIKNKYPADSYSLVLSSHSNGWFPAKKTIGSRAFGEDKDGYDIDIDVLAEALPFHLRFILFDSCLMGGVESAYQLRSKTDYVISSAAEVINYGFYYTNTLPKMLINTEQGLKDAALAYYDYYMGFASALYNSVTVSVVKTSELEGVAAQAKKLFTENSAVLVRPPLASLQQFDYANGYKDYFFDYLDFIDKAFLGIETTALRAAWDKAVIYKLNSPWLFQGMSSQIEVKTFCGLTSYVPFKGDQKMIDTYKRFDWNEDSGMYVMIDRVGGL